MPPAAANNNNMPPPTNNMVRMKAALKITHDKIKLKKAATIVYYFDTVRCSPPGLLEIHEADQADGRAYLATRQTTKDLEEVARLIEIGYKNPDMTRFGLNLNYY
jgi:hypothetical protein